MKTLILAAIFTFSGLQACVTYNPSTNTYVVDSYGAIDIDAHRSKKPIKPVIDSAQFRNRSKVTCKHKPKISKQPRPIDVEWD